MTIAYADFVALFPEFSNQTTYPQTLINAWIPIAYQQLNACRLGPSLDYAAELFVAHNITLAARDQASSAAGGLPGEASGPVTAKALGGASKSFDASLTAIDGAGAWNGTSYGQRLYTLLRSVGMGSTYIPAPRRRVMGPWGWR